MFENFRDACSLLNRTGFGDFRNTIRYFNAILFPRLWANKMLDADVLKEFDNFGKISG
jgi:hypothetical protein